MKVEHQTWLVDASAIYLAGFWVVEGAHPLGSTRTACSDHCSSLTGALLAKGWQREKLESFGGLVLGHLQAWQNR